MSDYPEDFSFRGMINRDDATPMPIAQLLESIYSYYVPRSEKARMVEAALDGRDDVLRRLAAFVGNGGFNAPEVDPAVFERKIMDGLRENTKLERDLAAAQTELAQERERADAAVKELEWRRKQDVERQAEFFAERERAEKNATDAERYRWLRVEGQRDEPEAEVSFLDLNEDGSSETFYEKTGRDLDSAIDCIMQERAAIAEGKK